jgi:hypothetical protein
MARNRPKRDRKQSVAVNARSSSWLLPAAIIVFLLTRAYILFVLEPLNTDVENTYCAYAMRAYDGQLEPYHEYLQIPYPPIAWWIIYTPRFFDSRHITDPLDQAQWKPVLRTYTVIFRGFMFLCDLASLALLVLITNKRKPELLGWAVLTYIVTTAILAHVLYDRLDLALLVAILAWAYCWFRTHESSGHSLTWSIAGYTILGLSISYKLIPVIIVPFLLLADWRAPIRAVRLSTGLAALILATGVPFAIQFAISGPEVFSLFKYHGERGIQVESLYSSFMMIGSLFGLPAYVVESHGAYDLEGSMTKLMMLLSSVILICFLAGVWLWLFFRRKEGSANDAYHAAFYALIGAVIFSKVLSPQYFVWAIPLIVLLSLDLLPAASFSKALLFILLVCVAALTTWIFPYHYGSTQSTPGLLPLGLPDAPLNVLPCVAVSARNLIYLGIVIWLGILLLRQSRKTAGKIA